MNAQQKAAMELALEALETLMIERGSIYEKAITVLKEALAQDALQALHDDNKSLGLYEQEPVAWLNRDSVDGLWYPNAFKTDNLEPSIPFYTTPPQRNPLTDEEIDAVLDAMKLLAPRCIARAIEVAHGIKE